MWCRTISKYKGHTTESADTAELVEGQKLVVAIEAWEHDQLNPLGRVVEILGHPDDPGVDVASIVHGFDLETTFSAEVTQAAEELTAVLPETEIARRVDLRNTVTFTIDPADAKDFDDAVSLEAMDNGNWLLGVHIADVGYYVEQGSIIDREAQQRGTSIYLVDRVIPMLPERLSNKLCSLTPGDDKLCFSVRMQVTRQGEVVSHSFERSVIRSHKRFSYEEAQQILDGRLASPFSGVLRDMRTLSKNLIAARKNGARSTDNGIKVVWTGRANRSTCKNRSDWTSPLIEIHAAGQRHCGSICRTGTGERLGEQAPLSTGVRTSRRADVERQCPDAGVRRQCSRRNG